MAALLADENLPSLVVTELTRLGHYLITMLQAGLASQAIPDADVLKLATAMNRCVLTLNRRDFIHPHTTNPVHSGIIVYKFDLNFTAPASRIHQTIIESTVLTGQLFRVHKPALLP